MTLALELGGIHDPTVRRAFEQLSQQFPVAVTGGGGGAPSGPASGDLGGTYPGPTVVKAQSGFTVGGVAVILAGDAALTNARAPTAHKTTHEPGGSDALTALDNTSIVAAAGIVRSKLNFGSGLVDADIAAAAGIAKTKLAALSIVDADVNAAAAIAESKLSLATDAAAGTGSRRTLGTSATSAAAGNRGLPVGGSSTQVLTKNTATDYDVAWTTPAVGAAPTYDDLQQGVLGSGDCALTFNSATQVTIAAGTVYVTASGALTRSAPGSTVLGSIPAASASNFRLDQVVVSSTGTVSRLAGTQGTTATIANRTGAAAVPAGSMLLHDLLVTSTGVVNSATNIRDRRMWARGAFVSLARASTNLTTTNTTMVVADTATLQARVECSGTSLRVRAHVVGSMSVATGALFTGYQIDGTQQGTDLGQLVSDTAASFGFVGFESIVTPAAGSHLFTATMRTSTGTATFQATANTPFRFVIEEVVRSNANNGLV